MSASTSPAVNAAILLWRRWFASCVSRPLRAAVAARFMSSEDGGVRSVATLGLAFLAFTRLFGRLAERFAAFFFLLSGAFARFFAFCLRRFAMVEIPFKSLTGLR